MKPWIVLAMKFKVCFVCKSNTGECQTSDAWIWEYQWIHAKFIDNGFFFWRCNKKQNRDWRFKWRQKVSYIVRLYNNTRIMTLLKWINWYCIDKTGDGQMQISCGTIWNYSSTVTLFFPFFFLHKKPTCKTIDGECWCRYREPNVSWVLTSINQETITDTSICPEKYLKHSFLCTLFTLKFLNIAIRNDKTFIQHGGKGRK